MVAEMEMGLIERAARALSPTLRHHGVVLHPDDVRGLVHDVLTAIREPSDAMIDAAIAEDADDLKAQWRAMIDAALAEGGHP